MAKRKKAEKVVQHGQGYNQPGQNKVGVAFDLQHVVNWACNVDPSHLLGLRELCDAKGVELSCEPASAVKANAVVGTLGVRAVVNFVQGMSDKSCAADLLAFKALWGTLQQLTAKARRKQDRIESRSQLELPTNKMLTAKQEAELAKEAISNAMFLADSQLHKPQVARSQEV